MLQAIIGSLCGIGLFYILADLHLIPYYKTSKAVESLSKGQKEKTSFLDVWLKGFATFLSKHIKLNEFKKAQLEIDLLSAQIDLTPEQYEANAIVKALIIGIFAVPAYFIFPLSVPLILILAVYTYNKEIKSAGKKMKTKRIKIEKELTRLVYTIQKTLSHNRDVLYIFESYAMNAGPEMKHELDITTADMKSGNYESAINRLKSRVGSPLLNSVCSGLCSVMRGDDTPLYWQSLAINFSDIQRQQLKLEAEKVPRKVRRLSMCLLICFMLVYVVVILTQITSSMGVLFS